MQPGWLLQLYHFKIYNEYTSVSKFPLEEPVSAKIPQWHEKREIVSSKPPSELLVTLDNWKPQTFPFEIHLTDTDHNNEPMLALYDIIRHMNAHSTLSIVHADLKIT